MIIVMNLLEILEILRERLNKSGVERTVGLAQTMGDDCFYYKKSLDIFERNDYEEIRDLLLSASKILEEIEPLQRQKKAGK
jgi:hypothetical protein